jgi:ribonuclease P protein component
VGFGFGPERRIRRRADFVRVQGTGQRVATQHFVLLVAQRRADRECHEPRTARSRLGIVVTKKVGNAVARARVKRLCRECFRLWPDLVPDGIDLVVIARAGAPELVLADVRAEWARARGQLLKRCASVLSENGGAPAQQASSSAARRGPGPAPPKPG